MILDNSIIIYISIVIIINLFFLLPVLTIFFHWNMVIVFCLALIFVLMLYLLIFISIEVRRSRLENILRLNNRTEECPICFNNIANYNSVCGHNLCHDCWEKVLSLKKECPICRSQIVIV